jgi:serine O-acetyltransferase
MTNPIFYYRLARRLHLWRVPLLPAVISRCSQALFHCYLPHSAEIGPGFDVGYHGIGVIVHARAKIGKNVFLGPGVVIGGRSQSPDVPILEDNIYVAAGAKILGGLRVGAGSVIGANAVLIESLPPRSIAAGVPAKIKKEGINIFEYTGWPPTGQA